MIPLSVPHLGGNEWVYIKECLDTGWVSSAGKYVDRFEDDLCRFTGASYAVACVNGTAALQIALIIAGVRSEDEVIVPTLTFIATVNAVRYVGARPVFMDADRYYNINVEKTIQFLSHETTFRDGATYNKRSGRRVAAIIPVHIFGNAVDCEALLSACRERNIMVIEDATESLGTRYVGGSLRGKHTGTIGDVGCFSFNGNKIITAGGGGMLVTSQRSLAEKARYLTTQAKDDELRYVHHEVGFNFRLTNIQAALGVAQLEMLPEYLAVKRKNYSTYKERIDGIRGLSMAPVPQYATNNHWMYPIQISRAEYRTGWEGLLQRLGDKGIQARPVWFLNHLQKPYKDCESYRIETASQLYESTLNIPCSVSLTPDEIDTVVAALQNE